MNYELYNWGNLFQNQEKWKYSMTKLGVPQQSQSQQLGLTMNNVHLSNVPYEIHPMQLKVSNNC